MTLEEIIHTIGRLEHGETPEAIEAALSLLEEVTQYLPEPAGRIASAALSLARDAVIAGKGPESIEELRATVRGSWQADLDRRFGGG